MAPRNAEEFKKAAAGYTNILLVRFFANISQVFSLSGCYPNIYIYKRQIFHRYFLGHIAGKYFTDIPLSVVSSDLRWLAWFLHIVTVLPLWRVLFRFSLWYLSIFPFSLHLPLILILYVFFQFYVSLAKTLNLNRRDAELKVKVEVRRENRRRPGERIHKSIVGGRKRKSVGDQTSGGSRSFSRWVVKPTWPEFIAYILTTKRSTDVSSSNVLFPSLKSGQPGSTLARVQSTVCPLPGQLHLYSPPGTAWRGGVGAQKNRPQKSCRKRLPGDEPDNRREQSIGDNCGSLCQTTLVCHNPTAIPQVLFSSVQDASGHLLIYGDDAWISFHVLPRV